MNNNSTQKTVYYPPNFNPDVKKSKDFHSSFYSGIFLDDVKLFISSSNFKIKLKNKDDVLEEKIVNSFENIFRYNSYDLDEAMQKFIKRCALDILYFNDSNYEIVFGEKQDFKIVKIPFNTLKIENGEKYQIVHDKILNERNLPNKKIKLDNDNIISFKGPEKYNLQEIMNNLFIIKKQQNNSFWSILNNQNKPNIEVVNYLESVAVANITKDIGWNFRIEFTTKELFLDHYYYHRFLLFQRFLAIFRKNIIEDFNYALNTIGKKLNFSNELTIEGITLDFVDNIIKEYKEGKIEYDKINSIFF